MVGSASRVCIPIARGIFTSVKDLGPQAETLLRHYNRAPKPIKWTYHDPSYRISADEHRVEDAMVGQLGNLPYRLGGVDVGQTRR